MQSLLTHGRGVRPIEVVVLYFRSPLIFDTLDALAAQVASDAIQIVDNGSDDGVAGLIRERYPGCQIIERLGTHGYADGMNFGIGLTDAEYVLLMTHDCVLTPGAIASMLARVREAPDVGMVGPLLVPSNNADRVWSRGGTIERGQPVHPHQGEPKMLHVGRNPQPVQWLDGTCLLVRRSALGREPFDEGYFMYFEDVDFCCQLRKQGWMIECVSTATARTSPGVGPGALALWTRNRLRFAWRNCRRYFPYQLLRVLRWCTPFTPKGRLRIRGLLSFLSSKPASKLFELRTL